MMTRKIWLLMLVVLVTAAGLLAAQEPRAVVEYFENNSGEMYVRTPDGGEYNATQFGFGEELPLGTTVVTLDGDYAEIRLDPNGTIIKIAENTNFVVDSLQGRDGATENAFSVAVGKLRTVAAKHDGARYIFKGATAVCGVRGTQFVYAVLPGQQEAAYVIDGVVDFTNAAGQTLALAAGTMADALATTFQAFSPPQNVVDSLLQGTDFTQLSTNQVPGYTAETTQAPAPGETTPEAEGQAPAAPAGKTPPWLAKLLEFLGVELGTVTLPYQSDTGLEMRTYAKAVIQPRFTVGKLKVALYLPIIYQQNMLDPNDWYHPGGNDEWSFGTDQAGWDRIVLDVLNDLFLKIRYIEWGEQRDPFFFKFGNLNDITIGHGTIMRDYANDADFPAVRKVGINLGVDSEKLGFEAMVNDAANPQIFGGRFYFRPVAPSFNAAIGITALADINPEQVAYGETAQYGKPIFLNGGLDLDLPVVEGEALSIILFGDGAMLFPYFREPVAGTSIASGFARDAILYNGQLKNWGIAAGLLGNVLVLDYRLEYRIQDGIFHPAFYNGLYDRISPDHVVELVSYLNDPSDPAYNVRSMGVYGELGFTLEKIFYINGGYYWPWPINPGPDTPWPDDTLHLELGIFKGLLPLYGSVAMDRVGLAAPLMNGQSLNFFDENLLFSGELVWPFSPILDLAVQVTTNLVRDETGAATVYPSISVLTRLNN